MSFMFIPLPRVQFEKFFQNKLFPDCSVSYHRVLVAACYFIQFSPDHEIQKGYILGVSSTHKLENSHWYHE